MSTNKIIVWMQSSLDGYSCGPHGELDWPEIGEQVHAHFVETLRTAGLFVYGRTVFEMMASFWPIADTLPDSTPHQAAYAKVWRPMPKAVRSRTLTDPEWNATVFDDPHQLRDLADAADGDAYVFGGPETVAAIESAGLVDEYQIFVHPTVLGAGRPYFPEPMGRARLTLLASQVFDGTVIGSRYGRTS